MDTIRFRGMDVSISYPTQRAYVTDPVDVGVVRGYIGAAANEYNTRGFRDGQAALAATAYAELVDRYNQLRNWISANVTTALEYTIENSGCVEGKTNFLRDIGIDTDSLEMDQEVQIRGTVTLSRSVWIFDEDGDDSNTEWIYNEVPQYTDNGTYIEWEEIG